MSFTQPEPAQAGCAVKAMAWAVIVAGAALLLFLGWHQAAMIQEGRLYGIQESWVSTLPLFLFFAALIAGAAFAARRERYGIAIALGAGAVAIQGWITLLILAGIGM